ncbi:unnamed protein product [Musa acuminata var. zebrina]
MANPKPRPLPLLPAALSLSSSSPPLSIYWVIFPELGFKVRYIFVDVLVLLSCSEHGNHEKKEKL